MLKLRGSELREPVEGLFPAYSRAAYRVLKAVLGTAMRTAYEVRITGVENLPASGPAILAANHISFLDSFFIPLSVPRRVTYLAKAEYWDSWRTRWFFETVGQIPVRRQDAEKAQAALEAGIRVLGAGGLLGIYPEGTRSPDGRLYRGKTGVARMALRAGCPIIPVGLVGTGDVMPKDSKMPRMSGRVGVSFGRPMTVPSSGEHEPMALRNFVDALMYEIREMSGQEYVDRYADRKPKPAAELRQLAGVSVSA
ncbi:MAG TPA: lysophospholipid acyltransferase family protein [Actinomycetota bacterium]|nr:lysophospholipid acyltransferase family protein [Actinomycetota bacterium]